ncbi:MULTISPECIES: roadblock/LC7 domain-containing protein [unclassified Streptomyces]|uniref:roadblock/LC7 domain-containing protein n=1 Tax=unclassified Streptomyces TaxID=2593676 RepID=UPI001907A14C|nr:roadblock/LC7 domain-containing protein [Streptomyces sp. HSG2]
MDVDKDVVDELRRLRNRVPQVTGSLAASVDGLVLAHDVPGAEPEGLAALTAAALGVAQRTADATGRGDFRELLLRGVHGYVATYAAGPAAVLTLLAEGRVNVGRLHLEGRRSGARIGELVAARSGEYRTAESALPGPALVAPDVNRPIGTLPVRTPPRPTRQPRPPAEGHPRPV